METLYEGLRLQSGTAKVTVNGEPLRARLDLANHSPTGFEWGYQGSGPAQLSLAICAHALGDDAHALSVYQDFKVAVVGCIQSDGWSMTRDQVLGTIERLRAVRLTGLVA